MTCTWDHALLLGDIVADKAYMLAVDFGAGTEIVNIPKGAWFASPLAFWGWVRAEAGSAAPMTTSVGTDATGQYLEIEGPVWTITPTTGSMLDDLWGTTVAAGDNTSGDPWRSRLVFAPSYPVATFDNGFRTFGVVSSRAHSGKAYTVAGVEQPSKTLKFQFAYEDRVEMAQWRYFWGRVFARARSASFVFAPQEVTTSPPVGLDADSLALADQLVHASTLERYSFDRVVDYRDYAVADASTITYYRRPNRPMSEPDIQTYWIPAH